MMTWPGYALIRVERHKPANGRAANKFLLMMQLACGATMLGAELLAATGASAAGAQSLKYDFDAVRANLPGMLTQRPGTTALAFTLFLAGFGIKMGMWPFGQVWLPDAHPAAPSPVSAMLSGVMIKTGVYGLMRYFLWLTPPAAHGIFPLAEWGGVVAVLGTITLFTGTMQAVQQEQSKRLLAFHSIGQIGYILLGTGTCMLLLPTAGPNAAALATVGFLGALLHVFNHGVFKALLFLNAGSLLHATGTQDLNRLGGLAKVMPLTALTALVASFSIAGVPLFSGFVSKWSIYISAIQGVHASPVLGLCAVIAILTSALTLASFIKFFGVSFLARTSTLVRARAAGGKRLEVGWTMQAPQVLLALGCVLVGVAPAWAFRLLQAVLDTSRQGFALLMPAAAPIQTQGWTGLAQVPSAALFSPLVLAAAIALLFLLAHGLSRLGGARRRAGVPWLCGYAREAECHRYVAHHWYGELKRHFRWMGGAPQPAPQSSREKQGDP
jgi:formate hydrogenlyase subunit 3/multisubunit Na+/H+ antiporter MnhD subunit